MSRTRTKSKREQRLGQLLVEWNIDPNYDGTTPGDKFAGLLAADIDGEQDAAFSCNTLKEARELMADAASLASGNPRWPQKLVNLDTGQEYTGIVVTSVHLLRNV